jgi:hypothetical protein
MIKPKIKEAQKANRADRPHLHEVDPNAGPPLVRSALPTAPVSEDAAIPAGYDLTIRGISTQRENASGAVQTIHISPDPIVISGRFINVTDGSELSRIEWTRDQGWKSVTVPRRQIMNNRELVGLSDQGLPVHSGSAPELVRYLSAYEATNRSVIARGAISPHMGWQGHRGDHGFLVGRRLLTAGGSDAGEVDPTEMSPSSWAENHLAFHGSDAGDNQIADGLVPDGTIEEWTRTIALVAPYPKLRLALYGSLASPLLDVIGCESFVLDWCGVTSQGKTTALRAAASAWGNPEPTAPGSVLGTWNASRVYIERRAALYNGIPVLIDDSKQAKDQKFVAQTIYDLTSGQGRGRGSVAGVRRSGAWRTGVLSTGEFPLIECTQDGGTRARVITLWGSPLGEVSQETGLVVNRLSNGLSLSYGHAGPAFVQYLLANRTLWDDWRSTWREEIERYHELDPSNAVAGRLGRYLAAIHIAAIIAHDALPLPWKFADPIEPIWESVTQQTREADQARYAAMLVGGWAASNAQSFIGRHLTDSSGPRVPSGGWLGSWDSASEYRVIAFVPHRLKAFLSDQGFDADAILRTWNDRDWLETSTDRDRTTKKVSMAGEKAWCYVVLREAFDV